MTSTPATEHKENGQVPDIKTLREAIPEHCFQPSLLRSCTYVVRDLFMMGLLFYLATKALEIEKPFVRFAIWSLYGIIQGFVFTGIWILAHECGHHAFSTHKRVNSSIGFVLHSMVLVPFFSWKFTHHRHHLYANNMEKDTVFVPHRSNEHASSRFAELMEYFRDAPGLCLVVLIGHQILGWPLYMLFNVSAGRKSLAGKTSGKQPVWTSHLIPESPIYTASEAPSVLLSDFGISLTLFAIGRLAQTYGVWNAFLIYGLPYLWMNHWLIAITYLHHTHPNVPHYEESSWTFQKGALSTIDRDFGLIGRHLFHGIIECHVVHHIFPRIPFYHAEEATHAIASMLGNAYVRQESSFLSDLYTTFESCSFVQDDGQGIGRMIWAKK